MFWPSRLYSLRAIRAPLPASPALALGVLAAIAGVAVWTADRAPVGRFARTAAPDAVTSGLTGRYPVEVVRVIDGDTFEARVHVWLNVELTTRVRLRGIDAPEMKARCRDERIGAEAALDALRVILSERDVVIFDIGPDKYSGRVVAAAATAHTPSVSAALLARGVARPYDGGRRDGWCDLSAGR